MPKEPRLFLPEDLNIGQNITIKGNNFDYLIKVMRRNVLDQLLVFNGKDGEFLAKITDISKKSCDIAVAKKTRTHKDTSNITLAFAPVKNVRIDFVASKATEMGVNNFQPIVTKRTIVNKVNNERFAANIKEACEQCGRVDMPKLQNIIKLETYLKQINDQTILILCDESGRAKKASIVLGQINFDIKKEVIIFIGPEGGFDQREFDIFYQKNNLNAISLGKRILRSDTAIISALALVNEFFDHKTI